MPAHRRRTFHETHRHQHAVLSTALKRNDGTVELPANLKGAAQKTVGKLLSGGLAEEIPARGSMPIWRKDRAHQPMGIQITDIGLAAIRGSSRALRSARRP